MSDATTTDRSGDARGDRGEAALATEAELRALCGRVRDQAKAGEYVEVAAARNEGTAVKVHGGEVESLTASVTASLGIRVVVDGRVGFAHAGSLADDVIADTLGQARENVAFAEVDPHLALARPDGVEVAAQPALRNNLVAAIPVEDKVARALELERRTIELDPRVSGVRVASYSRSASAGTPHAIRRCSTWPRSPPMGSSGRRACSVHRSRRAPACRSCWNHG